MKNAILFLVVATLMSCGKGDKGKLSGGSSMMSITPDSARLLAKEAWIYGYPMFYNYRSEYLYALDKNYPDYVGFNRFKNYAKSFTPSDTAVLTPNNDTPYSWAILNLLNEPVVLEVPEVEKGRYYVMQLIDLYTYNFAYIGTRSTGNKAGKYLVAGPNWTGEKPAGIDSVFHCETNMVTVLGRTELKNEADMSKVVKIQEKYRITPLHEYAKTTAPSTVSFLLPLPEWKDSDFKSIAYINVLNALLQYASIDPSEATLRKNFARIGVKSGQLFDSTAFTPEVLAAIKSGIAEGEIELKASISKTTNSLDLFGTRVDLQDDYVKRATAAAMGLFGNTKEEAVYVGSRMDSKEQPLTGNHKYLLRFTKDQLPIVEFFWSITLYDLPQRYLVRNPINRYSIGDRTKGLKREPNGDLLIYLQSTSPGKARESNWLPTPVVGPYDYVVRMYGPGKSVITGEWKQPLPERMD